MSREKCSRRRSLYLEYATCSLQPHSGSIALSADTCISHIFYASFRTNCFCRLCACMSCVLRCCIFCFETTSFKLLRRPITTHTLQAWKSAFFDRHFSATFISPSVQPLSYTCIHSDSVLVRLDKKKDLHLCRRQKASAAAALRLFPA